MWLVSELRRRNVLRMAVLYAVAAWLIMQVAEVVIGLANLQEWIGPTILGLLAVGFPIALIFSWFYELTPEGISLEKDVDAAESITHVTGRRMDFVVISLLCAAVILFAYDKWWTSPPPEQSIAVLPFENMSDDPGNEYFSDGISEEIINLLTQVPDLMVISRSSAFSFKGQNADIPTIAAKLNVAHVLEGSVRKSGNQLRLTAQLIEVKTDRHLWSKTFDREMKNIFAIQDEIAVAVVDALKITLLGNVLSTKETNPEAYALYLQSRYLIDQRTQNSFMQAETLLTKALAMDSGFAPAWTERAVLYESLIGYEALSFEEGYELARRAVQRALKIDPNYGPAYGILARIEMNYDWNFTTALGHLQQALELNPGDAETLRNAARLHRIFGQVDEAIGKSRQALALDPVLAAGFYGLGIELYYAHHPEDAVVHIRAALSLNPVMVGAQYDLGMALLAQGDVSSALAAIEQETDSGFRLTGTAIVHHEQGDAAGSDTALEELIDKWASLYAYQIASVYAFRSEIDDAFGWLEQAYIIRDSGLPEMLTDPLLANLHEDPRWDAFLDKMSLPH